MGISVLIVGGGGREARPGLEDRENPLVSKDLRRAGQPRGRSPRGVRSPPPSTTSAGCGTSRWRRGST